MKKIVIFLCILILNACGGGSSSSSGGTSNGTAGPTAFAGTYKGTLLVTVFFDGQAGTDSQGITLRIADNGLVTIATAEANNVACVSAPTPTFINGSIVPMNGAGTCFAPEIGTCDIEFEGSIQMSSASGVGRAEGTIKCSFGTANLVYDIGVKKI